MACVKDLSLNIAIRAEGSALTYTTWADFLTEVTGWAFQFETAEVGAGFEIVEGDKIENSTLRSLLRSYNVSVTMNELSTDNWSATEKDYDGCDNYDIAFWDSDKLLGWVVYGIPLIALPTTKSGEVQKYILTGERRITEVA